jgi:hypothetical protein
VAVEGLIRKTVALTLVNATGSFNVLLLFALTATGENGALMHKTLAK